MVNLDSLPEECFSEILSLTSPRDACNASLVSSSVRSGRSFCRWIVKGSYVGKKHFALAARELSIVWADNPLYWTQKHYPARFPEAVELRTICWLEIQAHFPTKFLSPDTTYAAYLVLQLADRAYGLDSPCVGQSREFRC
ncbi:unnamed protein product [Linum tenue]|uniref:F-box domain-containing protein n=1 Tax=Linum tenue TaxID=586396 RepID=A0AAV0R4I9_9ROSI|nr:unnamed protein product [Linum tenue]